MAPLIDITKILVPLDRDNKRYISFHENNNNIYASFSTSIFT